jgi:hypothetical protein
MVDASRVSVTASGRDRDADGLWQINAAKDDAGVGWRGAQGQLNPLARVKTDADSSGDGLEGALTNSFG